MKENEQKNRHLCSHYVLGECSLLGGGNHNDNCIGERNCINVLLERIKKLEDLTNRLDNANRIKSEFIYNVAKCLRKDRQPLEILNEIQQLAKIYEVQTK